MKAKITNPNNCETCDYKHMTDEGHCYMFKDEPTEVCKIHTKMKIPDLSLSAETIRLLAAVFGIKGEK